MRLQASTHLLLFLEIIFLGLSSTRAADHGPVAVQAIQLHHGKAGMHPNELVSQHTNVLAAEVCRRVAALLQQKVIAINRLQAATYAVAKDDNLSAEERIFQIHTLDIIQKELNESEASIFQAVLGLHRALQGDYRDILNMKESSKQRLEALREAAIKEEQEFIQLSLAERHKTEALKRQRVRNSSRSLVDSLMEDVRMAADRLEEEIQEHAFDNSKFVKGVHVEAVLRVAGMDSDQQREFNGTLMDDHINDLGLSMLIDSLNNQYILARPRDSTIPRSDHHFIKDIVLLMLFSLPCGWLCCHMKLPTMLGYIICGVLLGPSSLNMIKSLVQVETLGEFGVFFIIFFVGLEFSPDKLRKVWQISLQTPLAILFLMSVAGLAWGYGLNIAPKQSLFISACLSLSSTPLVSKFLSGHARPHREDEPDYGTLLLGMLVMQDMEMSLIIALMPTVTQARRASTDSSLQELLRVCWLVGRVLLSLIVTSLFCLIFRHYLLVPLLRKLHNAPRSQELITVGLISIIFLFLTVTDALHISMELGCFLAGMLVSSQTVIPIAEITSSLEPIHDFLGTIFFASIGLHVFPTFVLYEFSILLFLTLFVVTLKFFVAVLVLTLLLPRNCQYTRWLLASGLAQVSEFSFVLGSRARRTGIISREVYLLILSVTTLSLLLAPVLWRLALARCLPPAKSISV
uniref:transmembrane and coiled-coil domain-containing protein 3 isoform X2 n=1 Tax=Myxine glutinosa TaxID=7769 RepID=UPI00358FBB88